MVASVRKKVDKEFDESLMKGDRELMSVCITPHLLCTLRLGSLQG